MKKFILLISIGIVLIISFFIFKNINNNYSASELKFKKEYENINGEVWEIDGYKGNYIEVNIPKNNLIKYAANSDIVSLLKNGTHVIYFGNAYCNWCRSAVTVLIDSAKEFNLEEIYYYDFFSLRDSYEEGLDQELVSIYEDIVKELDQFIDKTFDENSKVYGKKRLSAPMVVIVSEGKVVDAHYKTVDSHINYNKDLNKEQKEELKNIYLKMFNKLVYACGDNC